MERRIAKLNLVSNRKGHGSANSVDALVATESTLGKLSSRPIAGHFHQYWNGPDTSNASQMRDSISVNNATHPDLLSSAYKLVDHF